MKLIVGFILGVVAALAVGFVLGLKQFAIYEGSPDLDPGRDSGLDDLEAESRWERRRREQLELQKRAAWDGRRYAGDIAGPSPAISTSSKSSAGSTTGSGGAAGPETERVFTSDGWQDGPGWWRSGRHG